MNRFSKSAIRAGVLALAAASPFAAPPFDSPSMGPGFAQAEEAPEASPQQLEQMRQWIHTLAVQAATYAAPAVAMYNLRDGDAVGPNAKSRPNEIWRIETIPTPELAAESGYLTPNVSVLQGFGFLDLGPEPVVLSAPSSNNRYYIVEIVDMWTNAFARVGGLATGYKGGKFALVAPGWKGDLPKGVQRIDAPTRWVRIQSRVHVANESDVPGARDVLEAITVQGLAHSANTAPPPTPAHDYPTPMMNPKVANSLMAFEDPLQFWEIFSNVLNENPPPKGQIEQLLPSLKYLGLEFGKPWSRWSVSPMVAEEMRNVAQSVAPMMKTVWPIIGRDVNGWLIPPPTSGNSGVDFLTRAIVAVVGPIGATPAEAISYQGLLDSDREQLTGEKRYTITFKQPMKVVPPGFWSMTLYDSQTFATAPNAINRYALGSDDPLATNADGSLTIFVQKDDPGPEKESNWLPAPAGPFTLVIRTYAPAPEVVKSLTDPDAFPLPPPVVPVAH